VHRGAVWHGVRHLLRKGPFGRTTTRRTDLDLGARRRHCAPDRRQIAPRALFLTPHLDTLEGRLTMRTAGHLMRQGPVGMLRSPQGLAVMARLAAMRLVARLP
jgi:hypothetical protein